MVVFHGERRRFIHEVIINKDTKRITRKFCLCLRLSLSYMHCSNA